jgi:hypothetical protein
MDCRLISRALVIHSIVAGVVSLLALSGSPVLAIDYYFSTCGHVARTTGCEDSSSLATCTSPGLSAGNPWCPDPGGDGTSEIFGYLMNGTGPEARAGDTIYLCADACDGSGSGTVLQEADILTQVPGPITVTGFPGEDVTIDGGEGAGPNLGRSLHVNNNDGSHANYTFSNYNLTHFRANFFYLPQAADGWTISGMEMSYLGELQTDIGVGDTPSCGPTHLKNPYAVYMQDNSNNVRTFTFKENKVHHLCKFAIRCNNHPTTTAIVYKDNEFYNMAAVNNDFDCVHMTISNNTIWDVVDAISVENRSHHVVVEDNQIECRGVYNVHGNGGQRNCRSGILVKDSGQGSIPGLIHDITIRRNTIRGFTSSNEGMMYAGISWEAECLNSAGCTNINGIIENNFISYLVPYLDGPQCCGRGAIDVRTNKGLTIRNNTIVRPMLGLQLDGTVSGVVHDVRNNLIIDSQTSTGSLMQNVHVYNNAANSTFTNNNFWNSLGSTNMVRYESGTSYSCSQINSGNFPTNNVCFQPTLQNISGAPSNWNLHLQANDTGAIDRGTSASAPGDDIDKDPRTGSVDIGADEQGSDTTAPAAPRNLREGP